ncbi:MAG: L,D-transpeptidase [Chloroflexota bacterium]
MALAIGVRHAVAAVLVVALGIGIAAPNAVHAEDVWVQTTAPTELWAGTAPDSASFGPVRSRSYFRLHGERLGDRIYVYNPRTQNFAYINADVIQPSAAPPADYLAGPRVLQPLGLPGRIVGTTSAYREPLIDDRLFVAEMEHNASVEARDRVEADDGSEWVRLADGTFVPAEGVRVPPAVVQARTGRWIDVSLEAPTIVTAYEDGKPVYTTLAIHGIDGWETPTGTYVLERRVANETMRGPTWYVTGVLFTQYFTGSGHSIHYNYWSSNWGYAGSHGCLGMTYADSLWFWEWATIGTPIVIRD